MQIIYWLKPDSSRGTLVPHKSDEPNSRAAKPCEPEVVGRGLKFQGEQDGIGVGGHGVQLSPHIHQEYIFRRKSACRTPAESRQEYLTRGKRYIEPRKTQ